MDCNELIDFIQRENIDYDLLRQENVSLIYNKDDFFDINFIITVRGRLGFAKPMYDSFVKAVNSINMKICYTVVEHSVNPEHSKFCKNNKINYIWIKSPENGMFNKCLAYNCGVIFGPKSKYVLLHDIDCLIQHNFFHLLMDNYENKKFRAIQCFVDRRVMYCNQDVTNELISKTIDVDILHEDYYGVNPPPILGAPGGSIMVERDLFFEVGGYEEAFFQGNSPEDAFFWQKVDTISKMWTSDFPRINIYHMNHPVTYYDNPRINEMVAILESFKEMSHEDKIRYIQAKSESIKMYEKQN
jgi:predicted glycosyltransferase involved in capsule biosynthesis